MRNRTKTLLAGLLLGIMLIVGMGARDNFNYGNLLSAPEIVTTTLTVDGASALTTVNITTANIATAATTVMTVATSLTNNGIEIMPSTAASLTSPSVTISAAGARLITITTDETQTGLIMTTGTLGQVVTLRGTDDSATIRVDDGTSFTINENAVLGLNDYITLQCINANGNAWAECYARSLN